MKLRIPNGYLKTYNSLIDICQRMFDPIICVFLYFLMILRSQGSFEQGQILYLLLVYLLIMVVFNNFYLYRSWRGASILSEIQTIGLAWCIVQAILLFLNSFIKLPVFNNRIEYGLWAFSAFASLACLRIITRLTLQWFRNQGTNFRKFVIVGAGNLGTQLRERIEQSPQFGLVFEGFFDDSSEAGNLTKRYLGNNDQITEFVLKNQIDFVYIALPMRAEKRMLEVVSALQDLPITVYLVPDIFIFELMYTRLDDINGIPVFALYGTPFVGVQAILKRLEDIVLSSAILAMILPVMVLIASAIKISSRGPIFFKQRRYGLFGEEIKVLKFRSMNVCEDGDQFKQAKKNDPRVTPIGYFLRRTSLDELPQFLNVFWGNMSIVGPRPHPVAMNQHYRKLIKGYMLRHRVKPGITGWAQINGWRGETETLIKMEKRIEYDLAYIRNWSLWLDLKIIFMTVLRGFTGNNAF